jgi:hypothetical protein
MPITLGSFSSDSKSDNESVILSQKRLLETDTGLSSENEDSVLDAQSKIRSSEFPVTHRLERIGKISATSSGNKNGLDWAIFPIERNMTRKTVRGLHVNEMLSQDRASDSPKVVTSFAEHPSTDREIWAVSGSVGVLKGFSSAAPFYLRLEGSQEFTKTHVVQLEQKISKF